MIHELELGPAVFVLRVNQVVETPNGRGVVQGRMMADDGSDLILVAHDPKIVALPEEIMRLWRRGIWVLLKYPVGQVRPVK